MNFVDTFLFEIILGRQFNLEECLNYEGYWCEFCDEDTNGILFCGECGKKQSHKKNEDEEEIEGICFVCGLNGKFIGKEGDDWLCYNCN